MNLDMTNTRAKPDGSRSDPLDENTASNVEIATRQFTESERISGSLDPGTLEAATADFLRHGCLRLQGVWSPETIAGLRQYFLDRYETSISEDRPDVLAVGHDRFMITVTLEGPFSTPELYAHPLVTPIVRHLLGHECVLSSFGSVVSRPGAETQHIHRDHSGLFDLSLDDLLPPHAITVIIPLVDLDSISGSTIVWPGSHMDQSVNRESADEALAVTPLVEAGSCLLMDYRLLHRGGANRSDHARPILYNVYSRRWFVDSTNFTRQEPVVTSQDVLAQATEDLRPLLARARVV